MQTIEQSDERHSSLFYREWARSRWRKPRPELIFHRQCASIFVRPISSRRATPQSVTETSAVPFRHGKKNVQTDRQAELLPDVQVGDSRRRRRGQIGYHSPIYPGGPWVSARGPRFGRPALFMETETFRPPPTLRAREARVAKISRRPGPDFRRAPRLGPDWRQNRGGCLRFDCTT